MSEKSQNQQVKNVLQQIKNTIDESKSTKPSLKKVEEAHARVNKERDGKLRSQAPDIGMDLGSPMELALKQSENLKTAQAHILTLEKELQSLRESKATLISAADVLKEKQEQLLTENENLNKKMQEDQAGFQEEKQVLMNTLKEGKKAKIELENLNQVLEKKASESFEDVRANELNLQGKIDIMDLEHRALQREKDKRIMELQKELHQVKASSLQSDRKIKDLSKEVDRLQESARKAISVLRVTIHNLEGFQYDESQEDPGSQEEAS